MILTPEGADQAANINEFFKAGSGKIVDCDDAVSVILSKGLIKVIGEGNYNSLLQNATPFDLLKEKPGGGKLSSMLLGDSGWIPNYPDYNSSLGAWGHENVIKTGQNEYFGFGLDIRPNKKQLEDKLKGAYANQAGRRRNDNIPGFRNEINIDIKFIDVAKVASMLFDKRTGN